MYIYLHSYIPIRRLLAFLRSTPIVSIVFVHMLQLHFCAYASAAFLLSYKQTKNAIIHNLLIVRQNKTNIHYQKYGSFVLRFRINIHLRLINNLWVDTRSRDFPIRSLPPLSLYSLKWGKEKKTNAKSQVNLFNYVNV